MTVKRVERIWRREGLKVPRKHPEKGRLRLNDGSCIRLRPERPNHVWSHDVVESRTQDGRRFRMLNVIDAFTREGLAIRIDRKLNSTAVIDVLTELFVLRAVPGHVRSDNGPEVIARAVRDRINAVGAKTAFIEPGSPWEKITKMGDRYLRQLIVVGMTSRVRQVTNHPERADPWLTKLLQRKPARLATVAMANKTARIMWAVLSRNEPYRPHTA
ncbi:hypothetical protein M2324_003716 [Rhodovulum sulfidophilum]|nr:hypothetical protein [Rhodovulum sulfidophilum]